MTGAAGRLGSSIVRHLTSLMSAFDLVLAVHSPDLAPEWLRRCGAGVCAVDYARPPTLEAAFEGANVVVLVSHPSIETAPRVDMHRNVIDAAVKKGVRHIFYTSLAFGGNLESKSLAQVMQAHLDTEAYLASIASPFPPSSSSSSSSSTTSSNNSKSSSSSETHGVTYTIMRQGIYSESYPIYLGFFDPEHPSAEVALPEDSGRGVAWAARDDLGEAMAKLVHCYAYEAEWFPFINEKVLLSGPEALPLERVAEVVGRLLNKTITIKRVSSIDDYVERYAEAARRDPRVGDHIREWATVYEAIGAGECEVVTPELEEWLGRPPEPFEETIKKALLSSRQTQER